MYTDKTIFYGALDWGLGHATRSVPIIKELRENNKVILGVTPLTKPVFDEEFPELKKIDLPPYDVTYSKLLPLWLKLGLNAPRISRIIANEHKVLDGIISENKIDVVISDNRFGLYSGKIHSVFITHQLFLKTPVFEGWSNSVNQKYISKFSEVWVPDYDGSASSPESLSGELSHGKHPDSYRDHKNVKYIGPQSRLKDVDASFEKDKYDLLILLSGPEPSRTGLEKELLEKFGNTNKKIVLVRGKQKAEGSKQKAEAADSRQHGENLEVLDFPSKEKLKELILSSKKIICRSGYSTLMDMHLLGKKDLILIPTPGQTEQEYLAEYWQKKFGAEMLRQSEINKLLTL